MDKVADLRTYILNNLNTYIEALSTDELPLKNIESKDVLIDEIDTDKYLNDIMIYILPDDYTYTRDTFNSDTVNQRVNIFIFVRKDTSEKLIQKIFLYNSAFKAMIRDDPSINGLLDDCILTNQTYYQGVEGTKDIKGMEYNLNLVYQEQY